MTTRTTSQLNIREFIVFHFSFNIRSASNAVARLLTLTAKAVAVATTLARGASAQSASQQRIAFGDAVKIALRQNITLKQAENTRALSEASVNSSRMQFLPNVSLTTSTSQNIGKNFNQTEGRIVDQSSQSLSTGISSSITLFNGFQNLSSLRQARLGEVASSSDLARARQTVVFTVASNFLSLVTLQEQQVVQEQNLAAQQALEEQITRMVKAGTRSIADLYQQQAAVASSRSAVVTAKRAVELAKVDLIQTLQLDAGSTYEFVAPTIDSTLAAPGFKLDELLARAFADRSDLKAEASRVDAANEALRSSGATRWPTVALNLGMNSAYSSLTASSLTSQLDQRRAGSVGVSFSIPIFDRGASSIASQQASLQVDNARLSRDRQKQTVALEVRRAFLDYESALEQLNVTRAQQKAADLALSTTQERYRVGAATLVELTQARASQVAAASALVNARYNLVFQQSLMSYYTGDLNPDNVVFGSA